MSLRKLLAKFMMKRNYNAVKDAAATAVEAVVVVVGGGGVVVRNIFICSFSI